MRRISLRPGRHSSEAPPTNPVEQLTPSEKRRLDELGSLFHYSLCDGSGRPINVRIDAGKHVWSILEKERKRVHLGVPIDPQKLDIALRNAQDFIEYQHLLLGGKHEP